MFYTVEDLVSDAKRSEFFPISQGTFADPDDFIALASDELQIKLAPTILSARQDFFLTTKQVALKSGLNHYALPERAMGNSFKALWFVPNSADLSNRVEIRKVQSHNFGSYPGTGGQPSAFYMQGDEVVLLPTPQNLSGTEILLFDYFERPNKLVPTTQCAKITGVATALGVTTFTVDTDLTGSLPVGTPLDFVSHVSPFRLWAKDVPVTAITATTIAVSSALISDETGTLEPVLSDYICLAQTTNTPMVPQEFRPILAEMLCYRVLKALGAMTHLQACAANIQDMTRNALHLISNRVEDQIDVVYDRYSILNSLSPSGASGAGFR